MGAVINRYISVMEVITWRDRFGVDWTWVSKYKTVAKADEKRIVEKSLKVPRQRQRQTSENAKSSSGRNEQSLEMESRTRSNSFSVTKNFFEEKTCTNQKYLISKETKKTKQSDDDGQEKQSQESINEFDLEKDSKSKQKSSNSMLMRLF